jgi:hypothetical protein
MLTDWLFRCLGLSPERDGEFSAWAEKPRQTALEADIERLRAAKPGEWVTVGSASINVVAMRGL